jgi:hypothetical protein
MVRLLDCLRGLLNDDAASFKAPGASGLDRVLEWPWSVPAHVLDVAGLQQAVVVKIHNLGRGPITRAPTNPGVMARGTGLSLVSSQAASDAV